jgi:hypothetical protein
MNIHRRIIEFFFYPFVEVGEEGEIDIAFAATIAARRLFYRYVTAQFFHVNYPF